MKLNFTFKHLDRSETLEAHAVTKLEEASRFLLKDGSGNVIISKQGHDFCVEVSVNTRERYFRAVSYDSDPYLAVDETVDKLQKQFMKMRHQVRNHKSAERSKAGRLERMNDRFEVGARWRKAA